MSLVRVEPCLWRAISNGFPLSETFLAHLTELGWKYRWRTEQLRQCNRARSLCGGNGRLEGQQEWTRSRDNGQSGFRHAQPGLEVVLECFKSLLAKNLPKTLFRQYNAGDEWQELNAVTWWRGERRFSKGWLAYPDSVPRWRRLALA